ncbi:MAG: lytic transglycosylase domain-containing protein [Acidimicrobiia bacterium]
MLVALLALPTTGTNAALDLIGEPTRGAPGESASGGAATPVVAGAGHERSELARRLVVGAGPEALGALDAEVGDIRAMARATDIPEIALMAYTVAQDTLAVTDPQCGLRWSLLAAIGRVESNHGRHGGAQLLPNGDTTRPIRGLPLDGRPGVARIGDTDRGALDGDETLDRAVGPMQFIPSTWRVVAVDANGDGRRDPDNIFDAALAAGVYLCAGDTDLRDPAQLAAAVFRYNRSHTYVRLVLALAAAYEQGRSRPLPPTGRLPIDIGPAPPPPLPPAHEGPPLAVPDERPPAPPATSGARSGGGDGPGGAPSPKPPPPAPSPRPAPPSMPDPTPPESPEEPQAPGEPQDPTPPDEPTDPQPPDDPEEPQEPTPPDQPNDPEEPEDPEEPQKPEEPTPPDEPKDPQPPDDPDSPEDPDDPEEPQEPEEPTPPDEPKDPEEPTECAGEPGAAGQPGDATPAAEPDADPTASGATPEGTAATVDAMGADIPAHAGAEAPGAPVCRPCPAAEGTPIGTGDDAPPAPGGPDDPATASAAPPPEPTGPRTDEDPPPELCAGSDPGAGDGEGAGTAGPAPPGQASG